MEREKEGYRAGILELIKIANIFLTISWIVAKRGGNGGEAAEDDCTELVLAALFCAGCRRSWCISYFELYVAFGYGKVYSSSGAMRGRMFIAKWHSFEESCRRLKKRGWW